MIVFVPRDWSLKLMIDFNANATNRLSLSNRCYLKKKRTVIIVISEPRARQPFVCHPPYGLPFKQILLHCGPQGPTHGRVARTWSLV